MKPPRVVIIGAGFGGLNLAKRLRKANVEIVLIDRHNYHTFQPLLYQVATAGLEAEEIAHAVRGIFHGQQNFKFVLGDVQTVDFDAQAVLLTDDRRISYDYLVLAAGADTNYFGIEGAEEYAFPLKTLTEAVNLRSHIIDQFELVDQQPALIDDGKLNVVVVGGGPTGVEMAGALCELFQKVLKKDFPDLPIERAKVYLVEASNKLLGPFHEKSQSYALKQLKKRGVEVMLDHQVTRVAADAVYLDTEEAIPTCTLIWAAGIRTPDFVQRLNLETTRGGRIVVNEDLSVPDHPNVFAIGDISASQDTEGVLYPQMAPVAIQGAAHVARMIVANEAGKPSKPFRYRNKGVMATIGRSAAVSELSVGMRNTGFLAWIMWLALHLVMLIGFRNRLNVLLNWAWNYFTYDRSARLIMPASDISNSRLKVEDSLSDAVTGSKNPKII